MAQGDVVAYPTEAVWGLGCDPFNEQALYKILLLKQRPYEKGVILVAANMAQFAPFLTDLSKAERSALELSWPGPNTWLVPDNGYCPPWIRGQHKAVALRVSAHPVVAALCDHFGGPIVSTSANPSGLNAAKTVLQVRRYFRGQPLVYAPGQVGNNLRPTQIRDLRTGSVIRSA